MKQRLVVLFLFFTVICLSQNDSLFLNNNTQFRDGIYLNYEAFKNNQPDFTWEEVGGNIFINQQNHTAKIEGLYLKKDSVKVILPAIWGFSRFGVPFRQIELVDGYQRFSTIKVRGRLCYYSYVRPVEKTVEIVAYNPKNRMPFRKGQVNNREEEVVEQFFEYETGTLYDFNLIVFLAYISDKDKSLWKTLNNLSKEEARAKLYKCLLIYNDRHPVDKER